MSKPFDATLNALIDDHLAEWVDFLAARAGIPRGPATPLDTDLSSTLQADRLFRIDGPEPFALHLELESGGDLGLPDRILDYHVAARRANKMKVYSIVILLRPRANASDLTGQLSDSIGDMPPHLGLRYTVIRLWEEKIETLLAAGVGFAPLAMLTNEAFADFPAAFSRLTTSLQSPGVDATLRRKALQATYFLGGLRYSDEQLLDLYMSIKNVMEDSSTYQWLKRQCEQIGLERGLERGEQIGLERGEQIGLERGQLRGLHETILSLGAERFGAADAATEAAIRDVADMNRLRNMIKLVFTADKWDDLIHAE